MTTARVEPALSELAQPTLGDARARVWMTVVVHGVVDFLSYLLIPIMPLLISRLHLSTGQTAAILAAGGLSSGLVQPAVAWLSDHLETRWLGTLGLVLAALSFGLTGFATSFEQLLLVQIVGAAGVGAFHPVAAAAVGQLSGSRRSLGVAVFFLGGMLGGITGNISAPIYVRHVGLIELWYLIPPSLLAAGMLAWAIHSVPHRHPGAHNDHAALSAHERRLRWTAIGLLYAGNVLRFGVNAALVHLMIEWTRGYVRGGADSAQATAADLGMRATAINGPIQAAMQIGMGAAGISAGWLVRPGKEKSALIMVPVWGALAIAAIAFADDWFARSPDFRWATVPAVFALTVLAGIGFGGVLPLTISLSQKLLPHRTSLASGLMMGGAWAVGSGGPPLANWLTKHLGLDGAFLVVAGLLSVGGIAAIGIPGWLIRKVS